jgi:beta-glucosidase-like glycosyl hydrolase
MRGESFHRNWRYNSCRITRIGNRLVDPLLVGIDIEGHAKIARSIAEQSAVLLENEGDVLPLAPADLISLAVIGPTGGLNWCQAKIAPI